MHHLFEGDAGTVRLIVAVTFLFIGPSLIVLLRGGADLTDFLLLNSLAFIMPAVLVALWPIAFCWPRQEPIGSSRQSTQLAQRPRPPEGGVVLIRSRRIPG